ncbi:MAG: L-glutamate gamma-semialdehyde dehydrogenase [Phycisphaerales bacterium]
MTDALSRIPEPVNEPVLGYAPGSPERATLKAELRQIAGESLEIPLIIGGEEVRTGTTQKVVAPHDHQTQLAVAHLAGPDEVDRAIKASLDARRMWSALPWEQRAAVFLRAAELLAGPWRATLNAATMLNQSKTCHQAEIDAACELIDFFRFNAKYLERIYTEQQDLVSPSAMWNRIDCRPLEGFVYAVTPFNFTSIAANLPHAPALMGNTVVWKPSPSSLLSNYFVMRLFEAAGLPAGVINFIPGDAEMITERILAHPEFAGLHYTGSTAVFRDLWKTIGDRVASYRNYPRVVGETGGKDFVFAHPSADPQALITALVRGAFEFQGQKCSAVSRAYIPKSLWSGVRDELLDEINTLEMGDITDFRNFMGAVIHERSFDKCKRYIGAAREASDAKVLTDAKPDGSTGWFVPPTVIQAKAPDYVSMCEEIFGPVLSLFVYDDAEFSSMLETADRTSPYGLTGAIFATDRRAVDEAMRALRYAAGNFYINDKPTGAVVGQQPFGGSRASGTNDKAGSPLNLLRWMTPRTIKETFDPPKSYRYPFMNEA